MPHQQTGSPSPVLRARYSNGYNDPINSSAIPGVLPYLALLPPPSSLTSAALYQVLPSQLNLSVRKADQVAFLLTALLKLWLSPTRGDDGSSLTWDLWKQFEEKRIGRLELEKLILKVWDEFVEQSSGLSEGPTAEDVLWRDVPLEDGGAHCVRVIDLAASSKAPHKFLAHPLVMISLRKTWISGWNPSGDPRSAVWGTFDRIATPRICYAVFLAYHVAFLVALCNLVLSPPSSPMRMYPDTPGPRELFLLAYSVCSLRPSFSSIPYVFTGSAIIFAYPGIPTPNTSTHSLLLLSLSLFLLQIHLPTPTYIPTPIYLFSPSRIVPLATFVQGLLRKAIKPTLFFFAPALGALLVLLSIALSDTFPLDMATYLQRLWEFLNRDEVTTMQEESTSIMNGPSHPQTRITLLFLFLMAIMATVTLVNALVLIFPSIQDADSHDDVLDVQLGRWERYGASTAMRAKRNFAKVVVRYEHRGNGGSNRVALPAPVNAIAWVIGSIPALVGKGWKRFGGGGGVVLGEEDELPWGVQWEKAVWRWVWRVFVGIPSLVIGALWAWRS